MLKNRTFTLSGLATTLILAGGFFSPSYGGNFTLEGSNNIYHTNFQGNSNVAITGAQLGLLPGQTIGGISDGSDPIPSPNVNPMIWDVLFSVDRGAQGSQNSAVNFYQPQAPAGVFYINPALQGSNRALALAPSIGIQVNDNITGIDLFGKNEQTPSNLVPGNTVYFSLGDAQIYQSNGNNANQVAYTAQKLGLNAQDVIDAIALDVQDSKVLFSLAPGSPSLNVLGRLPGDILLSQLNNALPVLAGPANINFPFDLTANNIGLLPGDNLNALETVVTETYLKIPHTPPKIGRRPPPVVPNPDIVNIFIDDLSDNITVTSSDPIRYPINNLNIAIGGDPVDPTELVTFDINTLNKKFLGPEIFNTIWKSPNDPGDVPGIPTNSDVSSLQLFVNPADNNNVWDQVTFLSADGATIPNPDIIYIEDGTYQRFGSVSAGENLEVMINYYARSVSSPIPEPSSVLGLLALGTLGAGTTLKRKLKLFKSTAKKTTKVS